MGNCLHRVSVGGNPQPPPLPLLPFCAPLCLYITFLPTSFLIPSLVFPLSFFRESPRFPIIVLVCLLVSSTQGSSPHCFPVLFCDSAPSQAPQSPCAVLSHHPHCIHPSSPLVLQPQLPFCSSPSLAPQFLGDSSVG